MSMLAQLIYRLNAIPTKNPSKFICRHRQAYFKTNMKRGKPQSNQNSFEKEKQSATNHFSQCEGLLCSRRNQDSMTDWQSNRLRDQWSRMENPETDPHKYAQLISDKGAKAIQWRRDSLFSRWRWSNQKSIGKKK